MEPRRMLFDVSFERNKILMDEVCDLFVAVGLGFQPNTGASGRRRREVNQHRFVLRLGFGQSGSDILLPIDEHASTFLCATHLVAAAGQTLRKWVVWPLSRRR